MTSGQLPTELGENELIAVQVSRHVHSRLRGRQRARRAHQWHCHHHYEYATVFQYHARTFCQPAGNYVRITAVLIRPQATAINIRDCGVINAIRSTWVHGIVSLSAVQDVQNTKATSEDMLDPALPTDVLEEYMTVDGIKFKRYSAGGSVFYTITYETEKKVKSHGGAASTEVVNRETLTPVKARRWRGVTAFWCGESSKRSATAKVLRDQRRRAKGYHTKRNVSKKPSTMEMPDVDCMDL